MLPKTPPTEHGIKRLAIRTEDHALEYADFDTKITKRIIRRRDSDVLGSGQACG